MKRNTKISRLMMFALVYFIGVYCAMYYCYKQPLDEHILIHNREIKHDTEATLHRVS